MPADTASPTPLPWWNLLPLAGLLLSIGASIAFGFPSGLLVIGAVLLLLGIWNLWSSLQIVAGDQPVTIERDAAVPSQEQEQKVFLLRALEDLEYEKSMGKIDEDDYVELRDQVRLRAKQALGADRERLRTQAEQLVEAHLRSRQAPTASSHAKSRKSRPAKPSKSLSCSSCKTSNDPDATFCKRCGEKLTPPSPGKKGGAS